MSAEKPRRPIDHAWVLDHLRHRHHADMRNTYANEYDALLTKIRVYIGDINKSDTFKLVNMPNFVDNLLG